MNSDEINSVLYQNCLKELKEILNYINDLETKIAGLEMQRPILLDGQAVENFGLALEVSELKQENTDLRKQVNEKDKVISRLHNRLQISPYGDDKIDELQEANDHLKFRAEKAEAELVNVTEQRDHYKKWFDKNSNEILIDEIQSRAELLEAAVADISHRCNTCIFGAGFDCPGNRRIMEHCLIDKCPNWKWRGLQEVST